MSTVNLSLTSDQVGFIDSLTEKFGFANRSEFMRAVIRLIKRRPELVAESASFPFTVPEVSKKKILEEFGKKGYSEAFLHDLKEGLENSNYFS